MATRIRPSSRLRSFGITRASADLAVVGTLLGVTALSVILEAPLLVRTPLALLLVFVIPGYTLSVGLFPIGEPAGTVGDRGTNTNDGITIMDRAVLSVGLSIATVVVVGFAVDASPVALSAASFLVGLIVVTLVVMPFAYYRRTRAPPGERFVLFAESPTQRQTGGSASIGVLGIILALSVVFAGGAVLHSAGGPSENGVSTFYFVSESANGDSEADQYPTNMTLEETHSVSIAVENREGTSVNYSVVGQLQRIDRENGSVRVAGRERIHDDQLSINTGEMRVVNTTVTPTEPGEYRLAYLLYEGEPPAEPRAGNAYREIHLSVQVTPPAE